MPRLLPPERDIGVLNAPVRSCLALGIAFLIVILTLGLLERLGLAGGAALTGSVGAAIALFAFAALLSHSRRAPDFYIADRKISGAFGGLAAAAGFIGLLSLGLAGGSYTSKGEFIAAAFGITLGYLVLAILVAPRLRGLGAYTPGDVLAARLGGSWARLAWAVVAFAISFLLLIAVLKVAVLLVSALLGLQPEHALYATAALLAFAAFPGGARSLIWTQAVQYFVIALGGVITAAFVIEDTASADHALSEFAAALVGQLPTVSGAPILLSTLSYVVLVVGVASLPNLLMRALAMRPFGGSSSSMIWGVIFSAALLFIGLVLAGLRSEAAAEIAAEDPITQLAAYLGGLPAVVVGLVFAAALAALFALGQATLFAAASALSHDIWDEIIDRSGAEGRRILVGRLMVATVGMAAALVAGSWQAHVPALVEWALGLAAAGLFMPLLLALWWRRCTDLGASGGMLAGFGCAGLLCLVNAGAMRADFVSNGWTAFDAPKAAAAGMVAALLVTIGLSLITSAKRGNPGTAEGSGAAGRGGAPIRERPA